MLTQKIQFKEEVISKPKTFDAILSLFDSAGQGLFIFQDNCCVGCNKRATQIFNVSQKELIKRGPFSYSLIEQPDGSKSKDRIYEYFKSVHHHSPLVFSWSFKKLSGTVFVNEVVLNYLKMFNQHYIFLILKEQNLVEKISNTAKIVEEERSGMAMRIEKLNQILKSFVEDREIEKKAMEENNIKYFQNFILPYLSKMATCTNSASCRTNYHTIQRNLSSLNIGAGLSKSKLLHNLSTNEVKIIDLIRQGKRTKEIAEILNLAPSSISWYRNRIRNKFGIVSANTNLRVFLNQIFTRPFPAN